MPITITQDLSLSTALKNFAELARFTAWKKASLPDQAAAAVVVPTASLPAELGVDSEMLLLLLPDDLEAALADLALAELDVDNDISDDLLTSDTLLTLHAGNVTVAMDVRSLSPEFPSVAEVGWFYLGLAASNRFVIAQHCMGLQWLESHQAGVQSSCGSSGINYRPHRYWSQAELDAAAEGHPPEYFRHLRFSIRKVRCAVVQVQP